MDTTNKVFVNMILFNYFQCNELYASLFVSLELITDVYYLRLVQKSAQQFIYDCVCFN